MFITLTSPMRGKIRVNFNNVCSYNEHIDGGSMIKFNFAAQGSEKASPAMLVVEETPDDIDRLLQAAKATE